VWSEDGNEPGGESLTTQRLIVLVTFEIWIPQQYKTSVFPVCLKILRYLVVAEVSGLILTVLAIGQPPSI
jgi:hypothetical protein